MNTVTQAVARRDEGPVTIMFRSRRQFAAVLPKSVDVDAFLGTAAGALYADEKLMAAATAHPDSLYTTLMRCASLGHLPGTDEFYLHPRKGKVTGTEGYRGIVERMYRSGAVKSVIVREVCAKDQFRYTEGSDDKPVHSFGGSGATGADFFGAAGSRDRGEMVGVYAYAILTTGAVSRVVVLNRDDVMAAREASEAKDSSFSPWNRLDAGPKHPEFTGRSMWWKTAARRLEPWVPTSAEYRREMLRASAAASDAASQRYQPQQNGHAADDGIIDAEIVEDQAPQQPAGRKTRASSPAAPKQLEELNALLAALPVAPDSERKAAEKQLLDWLGGGEWTASRSQVTAVHAELEKRLEAAEGDTEKCASDLWTDYELSREPGDG